ncbi:transformation/transcription domain-associated protein, putative, partial [Ixodes scapularis]
DTSVTVAVGTELLILSLDLVKNRVGVMGQEMRKAFIGTILVGLIEKSPDVKVLKAITKMVEDWVKSKSPFAVNQSPTLREKSILLVKMMQFIEKRFPDDLELNAQFLELVNYVYRDEALKGTELTSKLEPAFMAGLRCVQPSIRAKFFEVWEVLHTAVAHAPLRSAQPGALLPAATAGLLQADALDRDTLALATPLKEEPPDTEEEIEIELGEEAPVRGVLENSFRAGSDPRQQLQQLVQRQARFLESLREVRTGGFLAATAQLCHLDTALAQHLWVELLPRLWKVLSDKQQSVLAGEIVPFLCSGSHVVQKDCHPNAIGTFVEALSQCTPPVPIKPALVKELLSHEELLSPRCSKELNQWDLLLDYGSSKNCANPHLVLESAWRAAQQIMELQEAAQIHQGLLPANAGRNTSLYDMRASIHTIPSVPIVDCFQKIRQQVKCYLQMSNMMGKNELQEGLDVIESTNLKYFTKDMTAEFYALKGLFLSQMGRSEEANKALSAAVQMHDTLVKAWALWGDYLETLFARDRWEARQLPLGVSALTCFLHACRHQNEPKARKYLAKDKLWIYRRLFSGADKSSSEWGPEQGKPGSAHGSGQGAQSGEAPSPNTGQGGATGEGASQGGQPGGESGPIRATPSMWRCSKIMHMQRDLHPTVLSSLEGIVDQMVWFRENWYEEVLRQLRQGLAKCHAVAFENRGAVSEATVTPHTLNFLKKLVSTFGVGIENVSSVSTTFSNAASESLARRAQATAQDPVFQKMKGQFTTDFDFSVPGAMKLHNLINKLKKWIKILEAKTKLLPKSLLIEEKCRFLSNFSQQTAEQPVAIDPFCCPQNNHYYVRIARFMPRVEIVQKHNTAARRLYIRGQNGKIYPYLVVNDACLSDARREERVLQLLRMLNHHLDKQKETARRFLNFAVPRVVAVSPQMRLVEDNPASVSLLHVYKQRCHKRGVEHDSPLGRYYERLAAVQARGSQASHQVLRDILKDVQGSMVPRHMLRDWAQAAFQQPTHYWTFRKQFTLQLSLAGFAEFVMHLTRLNPDMMYLHQDSGLMNLSYFKFDVDDITGDLDANRPVPFRLTPNISEFITSIGVTGPMTASMIAIARCVAQPNFKVQALLRAVLRDEMIAWHKKKQDDAVAPGSAPQDMEGELLIGMVSKAVSAVMTRLQNLATFDGVDSKVSTLVAAANSHDNLCRMDPAWHPWL